MRRKTIRVDGGGRLGAKRFDRHTTSVDDLLEKAIQNEAILRRYQRFELRLLDVDGFQQLLDLLLRNAREFFQLDAVELWLYDPQRALDDLLPTPLPVNLRLLRDNEPLLALYASAPQVRLLAGAELQAAGLFAATAVRSAALLPLVRQGVLVGSLHFGAVGHQRFAVDKSTDFITHLCSVVAVCLENAVNQERLHRLSMYDMLTKVKNRRAFDQALHGEVSRATRSGDPLSLLFVDLDYFKAINDRHGHPAGDRVLREVARLMEGQLRVTDHVCRYGGEEFALLLPNCGRERALEVAERIRQLVSVSPVDDGAGGQLHATLSIGSSCWLPGDVVDEKRVGGQLIACADRAVYQAKAAGRNCVRYLTFGD